MKIRPYRNMRRISDKVFLKHLIMCLHNLDQKLEVVIPIHTYPDDTKGILLCTPDLDIKVVNGKRYIFLTPSAVSKEVLFKNSIITTEKLTRPKYRKNNKLIKSN